MWVQRCSFWLPYMPVNDDIALDQRIVEIGTPEAGAGRTDLRSFFARACSSGGTVP